MNDVAAEWHNFSTNSMTTRVDLEFWLDGKLGAQSLSQKVFTEFERIEERMSRYIESSELSSLNRSGFGRGVGLSRELFNLLKASRSISEQSNGAFDVTFASTGYLYDYRNHFQPSQALLLPQQTISYQDIAFNDASRKVSFLKNNIKIDLGGIAKGYAVDQGISILKNAGVKYARLSAGGDMRLLGDKNGKPWIVGIKDPRVEDQYAVVLPLSDVSVSTSGDYERFFIDDEGQRIHHILSPKTGRPVKGIQSVTVLGSDATTTDGLSTAVFVLGVEKGLEMVNRLDGIDAIIIDEKRKMHYSEGLSAPK